MPDSPTASSLTISRRRRGDTLFRGVTAGAGMLVLVLIVAIGLFLIVRAAPALRSAGLLFFTRKEWLPDAARPNFGVAALAFGTVVASAVALVLATPVALGSALFLTEVAPPRIGRWVGYLVDLLAAVPSVVYGLWGFAFLVPHLQPIERAMDHAIGGVVPILHSRRGTYGRGVFSAGVVLAIMVLPIVCAVAREIFRQAPRAHREAALALGATRWEAIRLAVLPVSRSGIVGAVMLGLGRALGETIAVALVLLSNFKINPHIVEPGGNTLAANIATKFGEAGTLGRPALIASGLVLFAITLAVNLTARAIVYRSAQAVQGHP